MLSAKQGSSWYHFYYVFGVTRSGIEPTTSRSRGERSTTEPPLRLLYDIQCSSTTTPGDDVRLSTPIIDNNTLKGMYTDVSSRVRYSFGAVSGFAGNQAGWKEFPAVVSILYRQPH